MTRALWASFLTMAALVGVALAIALVVGVPHPAVIERAAAAAFGLIGLGAGSMALSATVDAGRPLQPTARPGNDEPAEAAVANFLALESALRFGASFAGDFYAHVRPRLISIAKTRLAREGVSLSDKERARELLGSDSYALVDPEAAPPADQFEHGVPLDRVRRLVEILEALGETR